MANHAPETFTRMLHAIDAKDWPGVRPAFADAVEVDYSSLFGAAPAATTRADDLYPDGNRSPVPSTRHSISQDHSCRSRPMTGT